MLQYAGVGQARKTMTKIPDDEAAETFRLLYPIFKEEVYRRRAAMGRIARRGSLFFLLLATLLLWAPKKPPVSRIGKWGYTLGVASAAGLLAGQVRQEKHRHEKAKRQLIRLEEGLRFFEAGRYLPEGPLYPAEWRERPRWDAGLAAAHVGLLGTAGILIIIVLLQ